MNSATILHADLDAFYASVEQLLDPSLRGRPIAVGGGPRGVVLAASYEAKAFGVTGGMPGWRAQSLCPDLEFVRGHFRRYTGIADEVMDILGSVSPAVERISIDEAFVDVSGSVHLFGAPAVIAAELRRRVRVEVGLAISIGVARTKHLAKVASQVAKPDGLVVVEPDREEAFLDPLPVTLIWGVGPVAADRLAGLGIRTIGDLARSPSRTVQSLFGRAVGARLSALAHNEDPRRVSGGGRARSVGAQSAIGRRIATPELLREVLSHLADRVAGRLRAAGRAGCTVTVRVRFPGPRSVTRSLTLSAPVATTLTLTEIAERLAWRAITDQRADPGSHSGTDTAAASRLPSDTDTGTEITLLAVAVSGLVHHTAVQPELPIGEPDPWRPGSPTGVARWSVDTSVDSVRERFGRSAVGYLPVALPREHSVPDEFRELAEHEL